MQKPHVKTFSLVASAALILGTTIPAFADPDPNTPSVGEQTGKGTTEMAVRALNAGTEYGGTEDPNNPPAITDPNDDNYDPNAPGTNLAFTVPSKINFIMKANGDLIAPSSDYVYIDNESAYGIQVSSLDIDATTGWSIVEDASSSSATNAASGSIGPAADKLAWASYLTKGDVATAGAWNMEATGAAENADQLHLVTEGKLANVNIALDDFTTFATIHWYLKSGNTEPEPVNPALLAHVNIFDGNGTLIASPTMSELKAASKAIAEDAAWEEHADKANNYADPDLETVTGRYASYMIGDYDFVFSDDPQATAENCVKDYSNKTASMKYRIIGLNHDPEQGESGITFMAKGSLNQGYFFNEEHTNKEGWNETTLRAVLNSNEDNIVTACLPPSVKAIAKQVSKYNNGGGINTINGEEVSNAYCPHGYIEPDKSFLFSTSSNDRIWLISQFEIFGAYSVNNEFDVTLNKQYEFFRAKGVTHDWEASAGSGDNPLIKNLGKTAAGGTFRFIDGRGAYGAYSWTRGSDSSANIRFACVYDGHVSWQYADYVAAVVPCFCVAQD